jgi:mono/diheme cytochrome c family protein
MPRRSKGLHAATLASAIAVLLTASPTAAQDKAAIAKGHSLFMEHGCYGCHTLGKVGTPIAPDLAQIGAKRDRSYLKTWLRDPASQRPTAHMPKIQMAPGDADALAAYLSSLR